MINNYIQFISNNVKGLQSLKKRIKVFEYLKNYISIMGLFLQETHSTVYDEKRWQDDLNSPTHRPGSFGRRRPLFVCDGSLVTNIYLKPHNRSIKKKKKKPMTVWAISVFQWGKMGVKRVNQRL